MNPSSLLAFDTAGSAASAAVWLKGRLAAQRCEPMERGHAERLLPLSEEVMEEAAVSYEALDAFAVTRGPGTFTGVRIGLAAARGLALASGKPIIALDSFTLAAAVLPEGLREGNTLVVALASKRAEIFIEARAPEGRILLPGQAVLPERAAALLPPGPFVLVGDAAEHLAPHLSGRVAAVRPGRGDAALLAALAAALPLPPPDAPPPQPLYLRPPDVTLPGGAR